MQFCWSHVQVTMETVDNGRTYVITGNWDPEREDTLVLNTETKKGFLLRFLLYIKLHEFTQTFE